MTMYAAGQKLSIPDDEDQTTSEEESDMTPE